MMEADATGAWGFGKPKVAQSRRVQSYKTQPTPQVGSKELSFGS